LKNIKKKRNNKVVYLGSFETLQGDADAILKKGDKYRCYSKKKGDADVVACRPCLHLRAFFRYNSSGPLISPFWV
jgi:hypothetical protein